MLINQAYAQESSVTPGAVSVGDNTGSVPPQKPDMITTFLPLILIFLVFYFLLIRPQQKKVKAHAAMLGDLKKGDKVITSGGLAGRIVAIHEGNLCELEIAPEINVKILKSSVIQLQNPVSAANNNDNKDVIKKKAALPKASKTLKKKK